MSAEVVGNTILEIMKLDLLSYYEYRANQLKG